MIDNTPEIVKKISAKVVCGKIEVPTKPTKLFTIIGTTHAMRTGQSTYGDFTSFRGSFEAVTVDGKRFRSGQCFLPDAVTDMLASALLSNDQVESLDFAFEVGVKCAKTPTGYEYTVKPLIDMSENDPLEALRNRALPAPK